MNNPKPKSVEAILDFLQKTGADIKREGAEFVIHYEDILIGRTDRCGLEFFYEGVCFGIAAITKDPP